MKKKYGMDIRAALNLVLILTLSLASLAITACSHLQRTASSGYSQEKLRDRSDIGYRTDREDLLRDETARELGHSSSQPLNPAQIDDVHNRIALKKAEHLGIQSNREKDQYFRYKALMKNDRERLNFLGLDGFEARNRWLENKGYLGGVEKYTEETQELIENSDISVGMSRQAVKDSWGDPQVQEVAGNPIYGNERWKYVNFSSNNDGFQKETRVVYFESGRVIGWEKF